MRPIEIFSNLLNTSVDYVVQDLTLIFAALSAVGLLSMAILDILKLLLRLKSHFSCLVLRQHIYLSALQNQDITDNFGANPSQVMKKVEEHICRFATGGNRRALYSLPIDQLVGEIKTTVNMVFGWDSSSIGRPLEQGASTLLIKAFALDVPAGLVNDFHWYSKRYRELTGDGAQTSNNTELARVKLKLNDLRSNIETLIESSLNGFQIRLEFWWRLIQQFLAMLISFLIFFMIGLTQDVVISNAWNWVLLAAIAGVMAPYSHDIVKILSRVSGRAR